MTKIKFLRRSHDRYSKLGKGRKKKQKWKKPTGRDNKMREKRRGYPAVVSIGYSKGKKNKMKIIEIKNISDLEKYKDEKNILLRIGKIGGKKKENIVKKAKEMKIKIENINKNLNKSKAGKENK